MCISAGIQNPRPYCLVWMYHLCTTEEGECMVAMDEKAKYHAETCRLPYSQPARRTKPLLASTAPSCTVCGQPPTSSQGMLRCSGCKVTRYCGKTCQRADWSRHKPFCNMVVKVQETNPPNKGSVAPPDDLTPK